jgi:enoyl-CoA hydratase/carnithine racemase
MTDPLIDLSVSAAGIATITLNRPDKRNAMNDAMRAQFAQALERVGNDKAIRALVLTAAPTGEIAFNGWSRQQGVHHVQSLLHTLPKPTIAAVNGAASGLGADTALACDFIMVSEHASFTWSYIHRGIIPDGGGMYFLPRRVGLPHAKELIFTGRKVDSAEALSLGIADRSASAERLVADAQAWAAQLSQGSATALALGKTILNQSFELPAQQVFAQGSQAQGICYTSSEHRAAVMAFLTKTAAQ